VSVVHELGHGIGQPASTHVMDHQDRVRPTGRGCQRPTGLNDLLRAPLKEGLGALVQKPSGAERWDGPYLTKGLPKDPWDRPYLYRSPGDQGRPYDLYSLGADGAPGGQGNNRDVSSFGGDTG